MSLFRKDWTPHEADEWTRHDYVAVVFSSISYIFFTIGIGLCFAYPLWGLLMVAAGLVAAAIMYKIIDPKLRTISSDYETKQKEYLEQLDRIMKWQEDQ